MDQVTRLELSPSSPVLACDGKSTLTFRVEAYYEVDGKEAKMLQDRIPADQITVTSSDGKSINLSEGYSTTSSADQITFKAEYKGAKSIASAPIAVELIAAEGEAYTPITVPVRFYLMYTGQEKAFADRYPDSHFSDMLARLNSVLDGTIETNIPRAFSANAGVTFKLEGVERIELGVADADDTNSYIKDYLIDRPEEVLHIWVNEHQGWYDDSYEPKATFGNPDDIPMPKYQGLTHISDISEMGKLQQQYMGITMRFGELTPDNAGKHFEFIIGKFYGLLSPGKDMREHEYGAEVPDVDLVPDTYSYNIVTGYSTIKEARQSGVAQSIYYQSTNIMERDRSAAQIISRGQIARMRQVMQDVPFRQQGFKN